MSNNTSYRAPGLMITLGVMIVTAIVVGTVHFGASRDKAGLFQMCRDLDMRMEVWQACYPEKGCMGTYQDAVQLTRDIDRCKEAFIAP